METNAFLRYTYYYVAHGYYAAAIQTAVSRVYTNDIHWISLWRVWCVFPALRLPRLSPIIRALQ